MFAFFRSRHFFYIYFWCNKHVFVILLGENKKQFQSTCFFYSHSSAVRFEPINITLCFFFCSCTHNSEEKKISSKWIIIVSMLIVSVLDHIVGLWLKTKKVPVWMTECLHFYRSAMTALRIYVWIYEILIYRIEIIAKDFLLLSTKEKGTTTTKHTKKTTIYLRRNWKYANSMSNKTETNEKPK